MENEFMRTYNNQELVGNFYRPEKCTQMIEDFLEELNRIPKEEELPEIIKMVYGLVPIEKLGELSTELKNIDNVFFENSLDERRIKIFLLGALANCLVK